MVRPPPASPRLRLASAAPCLFCRVGSASLLGGPDNSAQRSDAPSLYASVIRPTAAPRHHIGQFSTPQQGYFVPNTLGSATSTLHSGDAWKLKVAMAGHPARHRVGYPRPKPGGRHGAFRSGPTENVGRSENCGGYMRDRLAQDRRLAPAACTLGKGRDVR